MQDKLVIHYNIESPIDAEKLGKALTSTSKFYKTCLKRENYSIQIPEAESRLYISSIKNNCILCEFIPALISALPVIESGINVGAAMCHIVLFLNRIKMLYSQSQDEAASHRELDSIPSSDLKAAEAIILASNVNGSIPGSVIVSCEKSSDQSKITVEFTPTEVQQTYAGIRETLNYRSARKTEYIPDAKLQLVQFNKEIDCTRQNGHSSDKGRIQKISHEALPIIWETESIAIAIKTQDANPTRKTYIVSVHVQRDSKQKPTAYHILELKDSYTTRTRRKSKLKQGTLPLLEPKKKKDKIKGSSN